MAAFDIVADKITRVYADGKAALAKTAASKAKDFLGINGYGHDGELVFTVRKKD